MKKQLTTTRVISLLLVLVMMASVFACFPVVTSAATAYRTAANSVSSSYKGSKYYSHYQNVPITGDDITNVLAMAISQWGYQEGNSATSLAGTSKGSGNYTEYNHNMGSIGGYAYYWCATFVAWCLYQSRATDQNTQSAWCRNHMGNASYIWREVSCSYWIRQLKQTGYGYSSRAYGGSYTPVSGDLIFFTNDGGSSAGHIGLVLYCDGSTVYTMEGNTGNNTGLNTNGDGVYNKSYSLGSSYIFGYGHLPYSKSDASAKVDYSGAKPTAGLFMNGSTAKTIYAGNNSTGGAVGTIPAFTMFTVTSGNSAELAVSYNGVTGFISNVRSGSTRVIQLSNTTGTGSSSGGSSSGGSSSGTTTTTTMVGSSIDANTINGTDVTKGDLSVTAGQPVGQRGWIGYNRSIVKFGYAFDYAGDTSTIVYDDSFIVDTEAGVLAAGGSNAKRYNVQASTSGLSAGTHKLTFYVVLDDWSIQTINSINVTVAAASDGSESGSGSGSGSSGSGNIRDTYTPGNTDTVTLVNHSFDSLTADGTNIDNNASIDAGQKVTLYGWVGYNCAVYRFGYAIDYDGNTNSIIWPDGAAIATEDAVKAAGGEHAQRMNIEADTTSLSSGSHVISYYVQFIDWSVARIFEVTLDVTATETSDELTYIAGCRDKITVDGQEVTGDVAINGGQTVGAAGWVGYNREILRIGYAFDYNGDASTIIWPDGAVQTPEQAVKDQGGAYAMRYIIQGATTGLASGTHTMKIYVQFTDWTFGDVTSFTFTVNNVASLNDSNVDAKTVNGSDYTDDISVTAGNVIGLRGWVGYNYAISQFGYYFDGSSANVQWTTNANTDMGDADVIKALAGDHALRYHVQADTTGLSVGNHTVTYVVKLSNGSIQTLATTHFAIASATSSGGNSSSGSTGNTDVPTTPGTPTYSIDFSVYTNTSVPTFGLNHINNVNIGSSTANGYITFTATGADPYVGIDTPNAPAKSVMGYVVIKYKTSSNTNFQFYCGDSWANTVSGSWGTSYRTYTSDWKLALVDASSVWGSDTSAMNNFRFDPMSDGSTDSTNYSGSAVNVAYIRFFASRSDAVSYINSEEITSTSSSTGSLQTWPSSNVLQTGANTYTYYQSIVGLTNLVGTSQYAGNGDGQHCFDGFIIEKSDGTYTTTTGNDFKGWDQIRLGDTSSKIRIGFCGWIYPAGDSDNVGNDSAIVQLGYQINNGSVQWIENTRSTWAQGTGTSVSITGEKDSPIYNDPNLGVNANARRYVLWIPAGAFANDRNNQLFLYAKKGDGSVLFLNSTITLDSGNPYGTDKTKGLYVSTNHAEAANYIYQDANGTYYSSQPSGYVKSYAGQEYVVSGTSFAVTKNSDGTYTTGTPSVSTTTYAVKAPTAAAAPKLDGASVVLGTALTLRVLATVPDTALDAWGVQFVMNGKTTLVPLTSAKATGTANQYAFDFSNITPQTMGDLISISLITYDTATQAVLATYSTKTDYSIKTSLVNVMQSNSSNASLVQLIEDLLVYGAAAQTYVGYKTDALVTDGLTLTPSTATPGATDSAQFSLSTSTGNARFIGASLWFDYGFNRLAFSYTQSGTANITVTINGAAATSTWNDDMNAYIVYSDNLSITNNSDQFTVKLCENGTCIQTLTYSVNVYAYNTYTKTDSSGNPTLGAQLALALYRYGVSAKAYVG